MTTEKQVEANKIQDLQKDEFKLESLISRICEIETKCEKMQLVERHLKTEQEMRMNLEQKVLELQEKLQEYKHKYQETIGWVDELEDKLRQEQQKQKAYDKRLTELNKKLTSLEKECNERFVPIAEKKCERCHQAEEDVLNEDKSEDLSGILDGRTMEEALYEAAELGDTRTVRLLIANGANVHKRKEDEYLFDDPTPLHAAAASGHESVVFALIKASADVNARAYSSATPLICAARAGNVEICQLLIKFGANVNFRDSGRMTALHYACSQGSKTLARLLIRNNASLAARANGKTPADIAESCGHTSLAKYIRSKMT